METHGAGTGTPHPALGRGHQNGQTGGWRRRHIDTTMRQRISKMAAQGIALDSVRDKILKDTQHPTTQEEYHRCKNAPCEPSAASFARSPTTTRTVTSDNNFRN